MIEILIADNHPIFRKGLSSFISKVPGNLVIAEADNGKDAYAKIIHYNPDIVFIDITISYMNCFEIIKAAKSQTLKTQFVIFTLQNNMQYYQKSMKVGASAFLSKEIPLKELKKCIDVLSKREKYVNPFIKKSIADTITSLDDLTTREIQVLRKLTEGKTNRQIAEEFSCGEKNIERFKTNIRKKLNINSSYGSLLSWAIRNKSFLDLDDFSVLNSI